MTREAAWIQIGRALIGMTIVSLSLYWAAEQDHWISFVVLSLFWMGFVYLIAKAVRIVRAG